MLLRLGMGAGTLPGTPSLPDDEPPGFTNIKKQGNKKKRVTKKIPPSRGIAFPVIERKQKIKRRNNK